MTQAVAYVTGRSEVLYSLFFLASLLAARQWMRAGGWWRSVSFLLWVCSLAAKESGGRYFPLVLVCYDAWLMDGDGAARRRRIMRLLPARGLAGAAVRRGPSGRAGDPGVPGGVGTGLALRARHPGRVLAIRGPVHLAERADDHPHPAVPRRVHGPRRLHSSRGSSRCWARCGGSGACRRSSAWACCWPWRSSRPRASSSSPASASRWQNTGPTCRRWDSFWPAGRWPGSSGPGPERWAAPRVWWWPSPCSSSRSWPGSP